MPHPRRRVEAVSLARAGLLLAGICPALGGCALFGDATPAAAEWATPYPVAPERLGTADIQVFRLNTRLSLTNTTTRELPAGRLWLNRRFSRPVEALPPGASLDLPLTDFVDEFGEPFRAGGFFATVQPDPVVLVEWAGAGADPDAPETVGLVLVSNEMS